MEATIIFKNGTEISAEMNGNSLILNAKPVFPDYLSVVTVQSEAGNTIYHNAALQECASVDGRYWFTFVEEGELERTLRELREENEILTECILEMSEIIYAE